MKRRQFITLLMSAGFGRGCPDVGLPKRESGRLWFGCPHTRHLKDLRNFRFCGLSQIKLSPSGAQSCKSEAIDAMLPAQELVGIQRVAATGLFLRQQATAHCRNDFGLTPDHPAFRVG